MATMMDVEPPQAAHSKMDVEPADSKPAGESKSQKPDVRG